MTGALTACLALAAAPQLFVSVERAGSNLLAHLSARGTEEIELSLYELPADPQELLNARAPPRLAPPARLPAPLAKLDSGRRALFENAANFEAGLSPAGAALAKAWLGLGTTLAGAVPSVPRAEVEIKGDLVRAWRIDAPEPGWNYADVDLGPLVSGLYMLVMRAPGGWARAMVPVGDLTALCARTTAAVTVLAQERQSGLPRAGAEVFGEKDGRAVLWGHTAADGALTVRGPTSGWLVVRQGKELAEVALPEAVHAGDWDAAGAVVLDRRVAQPGDAVGVWAIFRSMGALDARLSLPDSARAELQLIDGEGRTLLRQPTTLSALGTAVTELDVPGGLSPGDYTVAIAAGDQCRAAELTLAEAGMPQLALACELVKEMPEAVRCVASDGVGRAEPGVAIHWRLEHPLEGPAEEENSGGAITGPDGSVSLRLSPVSGGQRLSAEAVDAFGRSVSTSFTARDTPPIRLAFRSDRRLLRPGRNATLTLEGSSGGEPFHGRVRITATSVRAGTSGESQVTPLFERWLETDAHGRAALSLAASSAGTIELTAATQPPGGSAHATLFVSENGGDIPATPERLTLIPEVGDRHRGEETHLLLLTPFESGTVLLSYEPPLLPTQAVSIHGYSAVVHLTLPAGSGALTAVAAALRAGRVITDRLPLLLPRALPMTLRASFDRPARPGGRFALNLDTADEEGHPLVSQVAIVGAQADPPPLAELLFPPRRSVAIQDAVSISDSLAPAPALEPENTTPFGPPRVEAGALPQTGSLQQISVPASARLLYGPSGVTAGATVTVLATAGPEEIGEARVAVPAEMASAPSRPAAVFAREGDQPAERRTARIWPSVRSPSGSLGQAIRELLAAVPPGGVAADLGCAAVRAWGLPQFGRPSARGPVARLAQLENLQGGFGDAPGEMRRDLAALRGLLALEGTADPDLVTRTRERIGSLAEDLEQDDPRRQEALAVVSPGPDSREPPRLGSAELRTASAHEIALWLAGHRPTRGEQQLASARVRQLVGAADVLDLADLALAADKLSMRQSAAGGSLQVSRVLSRLRPFAWTQSLLDADEEPADPARLPVDGPLHVGDELEVQLTAPVAGHGTYCLRDSPPAGGTPEGFTAPAETVVLCGEPTGGVLRLAYRIRVTAAGRFQIPPPAFGVELPPEARGPEWIEVRP